MIRGSHATVTFYQINYPSSFVLDTAVCITGTAIRRVVMLCFMHHISIPIQTLQITRSRPSGEELEVHPIENM